MPTYTQGSADPPSKIEPGIHRVVVIEADNRISEKSLNEYINLKCKVKLPNGELGPTLYDNLVFTPKAFWKIDQAMLAFGFVVSEGQEVNVDAADFDGLSATARLEQDQDGYWKVAEWMDPNERSARPAPDVRRAAAPARSAPAARSTPAARTVSRPAAGAVAVDPDDDDIPF